MLTFAPQMWPDAPAWHLRVFDVACHNVASHVLSSSPLCYLLLVCSVLSVLCSVLNNTVFSVLQSVFMCSVLASAAVEACELHSGDIRRFQRGDR